MVTIPRKARAARKPAPVRASRPRRKLLAEILERVADGFVALDREWNYTYVNAAAAEILGRPARELVGRHVWTVFPEVVGGPFQRAFERAIAEQQPLSLEAAVEAWGRWFESRVYPSPEGLSIFFTDITELKRAREERENLLHRIEAEKRLLERLAECVPSGIVLAEAPSGRVLFSNRRAAELMGRPVRPTNSIADYEGSRFYSTGGRLLTAEEYPLARAVATGETIVDEEYHYQRPDGKRRTFLISATGVRGDSGEVDSAVASFRDVTESRQARDALRGLSQRLLAAQEEERRKISRDLHDDLSQVLTALKLSLVALAQRPKGVSLQDAVGQALGMIDGALDRARALSLHLRPPMLDHLGLGPTLRWYLGDVLRDSPLVPSLSLSLAEAELPGELASACFRVAQEAITNILRHAEARHLGLCVNQKNGILRLHVYDDGRGFDVAAVRAAAGSGRSLGLVGMQERVALAGGDLRVRSRAGVGTRVVARFPLPEPGVPDEPGEAKI